MLSVTACSSKRVWTVSTTCSRRFAGDRKCQICRADRCRLAIARGHNCSHGAAAVRLARVTETRYYRLQKRCFRSVTCALQKNPSVITYRNCSTYIVSLILVRSEVKGLVSKGCVRRVGSSAIEPVSRLADSIGVTVCPWQHRP
jgi:hypothetical protein